MSQSDKFEGEKHDTFYDDIIRRTLEVINEAHDCLDVLNDNKE